MDEVLILAAKTWTMATLIIALIADEENTELKNSNRLDYQIKTLNKTFYLSFIITYTIIIHAKQTRGYKQM